MAPKKWIGHINDTQKTALSVNVMMITAMIMMRRGMALERWAECMRLILKGSNAKRGLQDVDWG